jgi:hypothetical protein
MLGYVRMHMPKTRSGLALRIVLVSRAPKDCESRVNWQRLEALQVQGCSVGVIFGSNRVINLQQWGNFKNSSSGVVWKLRENPPKFIKVDSHCPHYVMAILGLLANVQINPKNRREIGHVSSWISSREKLQPKCIWGVGSNSEHHVPRKQKHPDSQRFELAYRLSHFVNFQKCFSFWQNGVIGFP